MRVVLASGSPRRRLLLEQIGVPLDVRPADIDETPHPGEDPVLYSQRMARSKARGHGERVVIAADTVVHLEGRIFGKPQDVEDAHRILRELSGRTHVVTTGVCVAWGGRERVRAVSTEVDFRALSEAEVRGYVATGEPMDKAGAYGIQGIGGALVASIRGSYSNVVGLPLAEVIADLVELGLPGAFEWRSA